MSSTSPAITVEQVLAEATTRYEHVGAYELSETYERMQEQRSQADRKAAGAYYTPEAFTSFMSGFSIDAAMAGILGPDPGEVLRIVACDPACGCGVFLVEAAYKIAREYASRLVGSDPPDFLVQAVLPTVITTCVFGIDVDPVAAELSRVALSLETGGALTPEMLERNVISGNTLEGDSPPAMEERLGNRELLGPATDSEGGQS